MRVAGLAPVEGIHGLENIDVTALVNGHMAYRSAMPRLLREVGWEVESDEFTEIEDPDPENHEKRQRELIRELDEARKEAEVKPGKRRFGFFKKGKLAQKKGWETYDDNMRNGGDDDFGTGNAEGGTSVLFDIEAIKAELASEQIEVKQLESTLPPMKLNLNGNASGTDLDKPHPSPYATLRETKSYDGSMAVRPRPSVEGSQACLTNGHGEYNLSAEALGIPRGAAHSKLSFESSVRSPSPSPRHSSHFVPDSPRIPSPVREPIEEPSMPQRPALKSSSRMLPSVTDVGLGLEHNAWVDEDDEDFGKERNVQLTFG